MFFDTFWALVLGFTLSGLVQAFVTRKQMQDLLGDHKVSTVAKASFLGMVSSSCSYAAGALSRSIFRKGADFTSSIVFMFASTNLVIELGIVIWLLIGWQFAAAEFLGGTVMITLLTLLLPRVIKESELKGLREPKLLPMFDDVSSATSALNSESAAKQSLRSKLSASSGFTLGDFIMMRTELLIGFIVAGLAVTVVPLSFWKSLFLTGHGIWSLLENVLIAPFLAFISFVCSVGNVPLAAALWGAGISFGGVISFIYADLISFPLVMIYRKYYGDRVAIKLSLLFWLIMSASGLVIEGAFYLFKQIPANSMHLKSMTHFGLNATTILNALALLMCCTVYYFYKHPVASDEASDFAQDPICGMQVRKADAPASASVGGVMYYFCMEGCKESFLANQR